MYVIKCKNQPYSSRLPTGINLCRTIEQENNVSLHGSFQKAYHDNSAKDKLKLDRLYC